MEPHGQLKRINLRMPVGATLLFASLILLPTPALAQITKLQSTMDKIVSILSGVGVAVFTIALLWVGFKMAFQHAKWAEVSNIVIGAFIVGGASGIANWLIT